MRESYFHREWMESWLKQRPGSHVVKIPDMPRGPKSSAETRFNPIKPFDIYVMDDGVFYALELKLHITFSAFPFKKVTENQINSLLEVEKNNGIGAVVINYRTNKISKKATNEWGILPPFNMVYVIRGSTFSALDHNTPAASLSIHDLLHDELIIQIKWMSANGVWDLAPLFEAVKKGW